MSNTTKRVLSAVVLIIIVAICYYLGSKFALGFVCLMGLLVNDEIFCNVLKGRRFSPFYIVSSMLVAGSFITVHYALPGSGFELIAVNTCIALNAVLVAYLFITPMDSKILQTLSDKFPVAAGVYTSVSFASLGAIFHHPEWKTMLVVLLFIAYGMDSGAWLFGKNFGKHKLWPSVSPNKTVEGLIGGSLTAGFLSGAISHLAIGKMSIGLFVIFCFLGILSQVGDLIQSKIKRQACIKDSSALIPGHGGVYDRLDSLLFLAPFYIVSIRYFFDS